MSSAGAATSPQGSGTRFTYAFLWPTKTIDPHTTLDNPTLVAIKPMYESLVDYKQGSLAVEPVLATSWHISPDNLTYTFKMRTGVRFHDGAVLDATAVKKSYERMFRVGKSPAATLQTYVKRIEAPDPGTLVVTLTSPYAPTLATLGGTSIVSPKALDEHAGSDNAQGWLGEHPAGTGPYQLTQWQHDQMLTFARFPDYWRGWRGPHIETLNIMSVEEQATQRQLVQHGDVDMAMAIASNDLAQLSADPNLRIQADLSIREYLIRLDTGRSPMDDRNFRKAIIAAFDYPGAVAQTLAGNGVVPRGYVPTRYTTHDSSLAPEQFNMAEAKQRLAASAYPQGASFSCTYIGNLDVQRQASEIWQANLAKIGITLKLNPQPWAVMVQRSSKPETRDNAGWFAFNYGNFDESFAQWQTLSSKTNAAWGNYGYKNDQIDQLLGTSLTMPNDQGRTDLLHRVQRMARDDAATVNAWIFKDWVVLKKSVRGYVYEPGYPVVPNFYRLSVG